MNLTNADQRTPDIQWGGLTNTVIWRQIPEWPKYEVSNFGLVRATNSKQAKAVNRYGNGRLYVYLTRENLDGTFERKTLAVHRLVASTFLVNRKGLPDVAHLDGNPLNNHIFNLRWTTHIENMSHKIKHGTHGKKLCERAVTAIRTLSSEYGMSAGVIAKIFGVTDGGVYGIIHGKTWRHLIRNKEAP